MITISKRCICAKCEASGRDGMYRMVGHCTNCGQGDILILYREGDKAAKADCPVCGNWWSVTPDRLATPDEIPAAPTDEEGE